MTYSVRKIHHSSKELEVVGYDLKVLAFELRACTYLAFQMYTDIKLYDAPAFVQLTR